MKKTREYWSLTLLQLIILPAPTTNCFLRDGGE